MSDKEFQIILEAKQVQLRARQLHLIEITDAQRLVDSAAKKLAPWVFQTEALSLSVQTTVALLAEAHARQEELVEVKTKECADLWNRIQDEDRG